VILVAAGKRYLDQFVDALHDGGAGVASLGIDPCIIWRAASRVRPHDDPAHPRVLIDVGAAQTRLVIGHGEHLRVIKTIDVGGDHIRTAVARKLGLPLEQVQELRQSAAAGVRKGLAEAARPCTELLAREALACVRYHAHTFRGPAPRRIELLGGEANDPQVRSTLAATLLLPVKPLDVFRCIDASAIPAADRTASLGEWAVALGLALRGFPHAGVVVTPAHPEDAGHRPVRTAAPAAGVKS